MQMNVQDKLRVKRDAIEESLNSLLPAEKNPLVEAMRYAVFSGGKRFRPLLALSSGECFGLKQACVLPFGCGLELIHNYSLVHDDLPIMDDDDFRRGKPSCHKIFGEDIALLVGDSLLALAFEVFASAPWEASQSMRKDRLIKEIAQSAGIQGMVGGQLLDITFTLDALSEANLQDLMEKKTGALILASARVGPVLAGASSPEVQAMSDYGKNLGIAFQIRDDILDSSHFASQDPPQHPNAASFYGVEGAKKKLEQHVLSALQALESASLESEELRFFASKLLELKQKQ
jgi:geranylgeranyl diphosphate synthase type II